MKNQFINFCILISVNEKVLLISRNSEIRGVDILQPYYHTIPTVSIPQVLSPIQIEFVAKNTSFYWADSHIKEIKRSGLTRGPPETLIDTGLKQPSGLAVDWISDIMFVSSLNGILVCNLNGEYSTNLLEGVNILSVTAYPQQGQLYWIKSLNDSAIIETSGMDSSNRKTIVHGLKPDSKGLTFDADSLRLYWITEFKIYYCNLDGSGLRSINLSDHIAVSALTVYHGQLYFADDDDQTLHVADKTTGK